MWPCHDFGALGQFKHQNASGTVAGAKPQGEGFPLKNSSLDGLVIAGGGSRGARVSTSLFLGIHLQELIFRWWFICCCFEPPLLCAFSEPRNNKGVLKLADFGLARWVACVFWLTARHSCFQGVYGSAEAGDAERGDALVPGS